MTPLLREIAPWFFSTRNDNDEPGVYNPFGVNPYGFRRFVGEAETKRKVDDYLLFGHGGHGSNSLAIGYYDGAVQRRLCLRIQRFLSELFVFVAHPEVPADNNAAERSLRDLVTARKISGGTRSRKGTDTRMALATLFGTWRARNLDPLTARRNLLVSPQS